MIRMKRRMTWLCALVAVFLAVEVMPAGATRVGLGPPSLLVPGPGLDQGLDTVVTMSADGMLRGFTRLHGADEGDAVWYFAGRAGAGLATQQTPYAGQLRAVAHDG